jgi:hypothetical protein
MKNTPLAIAAALLLLLLGARTLSAQNSASPTTAAAPMEYKMISGYKQPFNEELQEKISKGWKPFGGISVTAWNNDLFFAQLLSRPTGSGR